MDWKCIHQTWQRCHDTADQASQVPAYRHIATQALPDLSRTRISKRVLRYAYDALGCDCPGLSPRRRYEPGRGVRTLTTCMALHGRAITCSYYKQHGIASLYACWSCECLPGSQPPKTSLAGDKGQKRNERESLSPENGRRAFHWQRLRCTRDRNGQGRNVLHGATQSKVNRARASPGRPLGPSCLLAVGSGDVM